MSTIGGPGGIGGGPSGPGGPSGADGIGGASGPSEIDDVDELAGAREVGGGAGVEHAQGTARTGIDALAAEVAAGRLTSREAIDRLVDATAGPELDAADRAELRELLTDLVANDPYLGGLIGRI